MRQKTGCLRKQFRFFLAQYQKTSYLCIVKKRKRITKEDHDNKITAIAHNLSTVYTKYGVEKYDAFDDVGGKLSFALAALDRENNGIILNAVHSRDNCFLYLKEIVKGESYVMLSQEEVEALRKAVNYSFNEEQNISH